MKNIIVLLLVLTVILGTSCKKEIEEPVNPLPKKMADLKVKADFDWNTTKDYFFTISGPVNRSIRISSADGSTIYQKGMIFSEEPFKATISIPAYIKTVHLLYVDQNIEIPLSGNNINYSFLMKTSTTSGTALQKMVNSKNENFKN
ncbi:MAG: hypothetical protein Q7J34_03450 [Bacteroidales bacterium]|nr:hypothetical protein [Bacteroidales bacterium]